MCYFGKSATIFRQVDYHDRSTTMVMDPMGIADPVEEGIRLETLRHIARWDQDELAVRTEYASGANISVFAKGKRRMPDAKKRAAAVAFANHALFVDEWETIYEYLNGSSRVTLRDCLSAYSHLSLVQPVGEALNDAEASSLKKLSPGLEDTLDVTTGFAA